METEYKVKGTHNQCNVQTSVINIKTQMNIEGLRVNPSLV